TKWVSASGLCTRGIRRFGAGLVSILVTASRASTAVMPLSADMLSLTMSTLNAPVTGAVSTTLVGRTIAGSSADGSLSIGMTRTRGEASLWLSSTSLIARAPGVAYGSGSLTISVVQN